MKHMYYTQDENGIPRPVSLTEGAAEFGKDRVLKKTKIGDVEVSTVFLCIDHNFCGNGDPILWETMIFGGKHDGYCDRYPSRVDALAGHETACEMVRGRSILERFGLGRKLRS
jgi:hypothetical protein